MADRIVSAEDAQAQLQDLLELVREGHEVLIAEGDKVFARITPVVRRKRIAGLSRGAIEVSDDFDDPLPDSFWFGEE